MSDIEGTVEATTAGLAVAAVGATVTTTISATNADNILAAPTVAGQVIAVHALTLVASGGANSCRLESGIGGTALTGVMDLGDNKSIVWPFNPAGWCETTAGQVLNLELLNATLVTGSLTVSRR